MYIASPVDGTDDKRDAGLAALYFLLSTVITWRFIDAGSGLYPSHHNMLLSCGIAGAKWALQVAAALLFIRKKCWQFIRRLGAVCLAGSLVLLPYCFTLVQEILREAGFVLSLAAAVVLMIALYWRAVRRTGLPPRWFWAWMACLAIAVTLQLTVVFD